MVEQQLQHVLQRLEQMSTELQQSRAENQQLRQEVTQLHSGGLGPQVVQGVTQAIVTSMQDFGQGLVQALQQDRQALVTALHAPRENIQLVDTRGLGKPEKFRSKEEDLEDSLRQLCREHLPRHEKNIRVRRGMPRIACSSEPCGSLWSPAGSRLHSRA